MAVKMVVGMVVLVQDLSVLEGQEAEDVVKQQSDLALGIQPMHW